MRTLLEYLLLLIVMIALLVMLLFASLSFAPEPAATPLPTITVGP